MRSLRYPAVLILLLRWPSAALEGEAISKGELSQPIMANLLRRGLIAPNFLDIIIEDFREKHLLRDDVDVLAKMKEIVGGSFSLDGKTTISYEQKDLRPAHGLFSVNAKYYLNGEQQSVLPAPAVFFSESHPEWRITKAEAAAKTVRQASMTNPVTGQATDLVPLQADSDLFVAISTDDIDQAKLDKFVLQDTGTEDRRLLRERSVLRDYEDEPNDTNDHELLFRATLDDVNNDKQRHLRRSLQGGCSSYQVIEIAIAYDSTFCSDNGGSDAANQAVQTIVATSSSHYQQNCQKVVISHLEGYCDSSDPYASMIQGNTNLCGGGSGILDQFKNYWNANRIDVQRDVAHLFFGNMASGNVIGCAYRNGLCGQLGYGVDKIMFTRTQSLQSILLSHELGHNCGSSHDQNGGTNIMSASLCDCATFSSASIERINSFVSGSSCISSEVSSGDVPPPPPPLPVPAPGPAPGPSPSPPPPVPYSRPTVRRPGIRCFSGENMVEVQGKGLVPMYSLQIGDYVSAGKNKFSRVYSFGHIDQDAEAEYLQIYVDSLERPLEVSSLHMVFVNGKIRPALQVKLGDMLGERKVLDIKTVKRRGVYAPFTESGDIIVSGVLASSYAAVHSYTPISPHWEAHAFFAVRRLVCAFHFEICETETYTEDGFPVWLLPMVHFAERSEQNAASQIVASLVGLPLIAVVYTLEQLILSPAALIGLLIVGVCLYKKAKKSHFKSL